MRALFNDVRFAARMLVKNPGFNAVAVRTLALGIGANTAVFSVVNVLLLRPLSYPDSERLVKVWETNPRANRWGQWVSYPDFHDWRRLNQVFEDAAAYRTWGWNISGGDRPEAVSGFRISSNLFSVLRVQPVLGRPFSAEEDEPGKNRVVIISFGLWQRRFGSDPALVGRDILVDGQKHTVVGVLPPRFDFPAEEPDAIQRRALWIPLGADPEREQRGSHNWRVVARLKPGVTVQQAQANMDAIATGIAEQHAGHRGMGVRVERLQQSVGTEVRPALLVLLGAVGMVLLITCANVANLQLARALVRQKETAIRRALGAGRRRILGQLLTESTMLALAGGAAGLLLAYWGVGFLARLRPDIPRLHETAVDLHVLVFTLLLSLATGVLFGVAPALHGSASSLNDVLKASGRTSASASHGRTRRTLVVAEIAVALTLLIGAGPLIRSFLRLQDIDPGFIPNNVVTAAVMASDPHRSAGFCREVIHRLAALPGVETVGGATAVPLSGWNHTSAIQIQGRPAPRPGEPVIFAERPAVAPDYFKAMGISLVRGRGFTWADDETSPRVALISEMAARVYWPGDDPLGKRLSVTGSGEKGQWFEVIGIVGDVRFDSLEAGMRPAVYVPLLQLPSSAFLLVVKSRTDAAGLAPAIQREVMAVNKDQPVLSIKTMEGMISHSLSRRRFQMLLQGMFAGLALVLSAVGLYGVIAYTVGQRTHEIGIRLALGARRAQVIGLVMRQGLLLALLGVVAGLAGALALTQVMKDLLFGVTTTDYLTFIAVPLALIAVAIISSYIPARRAAKVDPMVALRYE